MTADDDSDHESLEETVRAIVREVSRSIERAAADLDGVAEVIGVDPARVREMIDTAVGWVRAQAEGLGDAGIFSGTAPGRGAAVDADPPRNSGPQPLDLPTAAQGMALAALDSGRWRVEPGSHALIAVGAGTRPADAPGLVDELRARDWIAADGEVTLVGRHALGRWLESADAR